MTTRTLLLCCLAAILLGLGAFACTAELECGDGTHAEGGRCLPNLPLVCGPAAGTQVVDGRCVPLADLGGTTEPCACPDAGLCTPPADAGTPPADASTPQDAATEPDGGDAGPVRPPPIPPECGDPAAGSICVSAVAVDFVTGQPAYPGPLAALLLDPIAAAANPAYQPLGLAQVADNSTVFFPEAPIPGGTQFLALVLDEEPVAATPPQGWYRCASGVPGYVEGGAQRFEGVTAFLLPAELVASWDEAMGRTGGPALHLTGALVARVLDAQGAPVAGAQVQARNPETGAEVPLNPACATPTEMSEQACIYYFADDPSLGTFAAAGTEQTGVTGAFVIARAPIALYTVAGDPRYGVLAGSSPGSAFTSALLPAAQ